MLLSPAESATFEDWQRMADLNLTAGSPSLMRRCRTCCGPPSPAPKVADLVNISPVAGRQVRLASNVYAATKHGMGAFSESLRERSSPAVTCACRQQSRARWTPDCATI